MTKCQQNRIKEAIRALEYAKLMSERKGMPVPFEVTEAEATLRKALMEDGEK